MLDLTLSVVTKPIISETAVVVQKSVLETIRATRSFLHSMSPKRVLREYQKNI